LHHPAQVLLTGRLLRRLAPGTALAALPLTAGALMAAIAVWPSPAMVAGCEVLRKVPRASVIQIRAISFLCSLSMCMFCTSAMRQVTLLPVSTTLVVHGGLGRATSTASLTCGKAPRTRG